ncbi:MAG: putative allophanate hydrolase [Symbiobacteriaceae bacterium]|nr:putative allophanate hydrolase [Symbiobacteriaceae bacterium]
MTPPVRLVSCGDRSLLVYLGDGIDRDVNLRVHALTRVLKAKRHPAVVEVTPSYHCLMVEFDPVRIRPDQLEELVRGALREAAAGEGAAPARTVEIPVVYGGEAGPDLGNVAAHTGLTPDEVVQRHAAGLYRVFCLGFSPGFPYLGGLSESLHTPRLAQPRTKVPAGSVAIGGGQTGVYPAESPGGWQLIGRTPVRLFDPHREPPALLEPGDDIRFVPVGSGSFEAVEGQGAPGGCAPEAAAGHGTTGLRVLQPGMATTVQDLGRRGYQAYGVSPGGAADFAALMIGNWLLGNRARTSALEITLLGPELEFTGPVAFCLTGAPAPAELSPAGGGSPRAVPGWTTVLAGPGDRLRIGAATAGCRTYLCIAGGIDLPPVLGSLSEDLFGKLGPLGRRLKAGDWLPVGLPIHPPANLAGRTIPADAIPQYSGLTVVRATRGPQAEAFTPDAFAAFFGGGEYVVGAQSDRQGIRLEGPKLTHATKADIVSEPIPAGSVQVPAGGQPILLLGNRQTVGGYTKIAVAVYPDLAAASQLRPGDRLRFQEVDAAEAHAIAWAERRRLAQVRRYLEREVAQGAEAGGGRPAVAAPVTVRVEVPAPGPMEAGEAPPASAQVPAPTAGNERRFRISILGIEFDTTVEEVES